MKRSLFNTLTVFILFSFSSKNKEFIFTKEDNTTKIEGFLIHRMQRKDAEFIKHNKKLEAEGKNHQIMIDYELKTFFIPMDSLVFQSLESVLMNYNKQCGNAIYQTNIHHNETDISLYCDKTFKIKNDTRKYCENSLKQTKRDSTYLYKIKYLKGDFKNCQIENTKIHRRFMNIDCSTPSNLKILNCYFLVSIDSMNCDTNTNEFEIWE